MRASFSELLAEQGFVEEPFADVPKPTPTLPKLEIKRFDAAQRVQFDEDGNQYYEL